MKKVSVCMLAYNTSSFIGKAIESALAQKTNFDFEIIIAENKSTDNTRQVIEEYQLKYPDIIKAIFNPVNIGMSENFLKAFLNCSTDYIAILDSDDYWCDSLKLQKQVDFLETHKDYGVVYSDCKVVDESDNEIEWGEMDAYRKHFTSGNLFFKLLEATAFIPNLTTCFRKKMIEEELEYKDLWFFEDWWLWNRLSIKTNIFYMDHPTACYRIHSGNISQQRNIDNTLKKDNKKRAYTILYDNIQYFASVNKQELSRSENKLLFRKILMLLYRNYGTISMKLKLVPLFFKYFPGVFIMINLFREKMKKINKVTLHSINIFYMNVLSKITVLLENNPSVEIF